MHSAGLMALMQAKDGNEANLEPIYLEIKANLLSREVFLNSANEVLNSLNSIFANLNESNANNTTQNNQQTQNSNVVQNDTTLINQTNNATKGVDRVYTTPNSMNNNNPNLTATNTPTPYRAQRQVINAPIAKLLDTNNATSSNNVIFGTPLAKTNK